MKDESPKTTEAVITELSTFAVVSVLTDDIIFLCQRTITDLSMSNFESS
jgi:hypothetical protein